MKNLGFVLFLYAASAGAADWVTVVDNQQVTVSYDRASLIIYARDHTRKVWTRFVYKNPDLWDSVWWLSVYACDSRIHYDQSVRLYYTADGKKMSSMKDNIDAPGKNIAPGDPFEAVYDSVCK